MNLSPPSKDREAHDGSKRYLCSAEAPRRRVSFRINVMAAKKQMSSHGVVEGKNEDEPFAAAQRCAGESPRRLRTNGPHISPHYAGLLSINDRNSRSPSLRWLVESHRRRFLSLTKHTVPRSPTHISGHETWREYSRLSLSADGEL